MTRWLLLLGIALLGCDDDDRLVTDADRSAAAAAALLDALAIPGAVRLDAPPAPGEGGRVERLCGADRLSPGAPFAFEVVLDDPAVDRVIVTADFATGALSVPVTPDADGRAVIAGALGAMEAPPAEVFLRFRAVTAESAGGLFSVEAPAPDGPGGAVCAYATGDRVTALAFGGPAGRYMATGSQSGRLAWWDLETGHRLFDVAAGDGRLRAVGIAPDGSAAASGTADGEVRPWAIDGRPLLDALPLHDGPVSVLRIDPSGAHIASGAWDGTVRLIDPRAGAVGDPVALGARVNDLAFDARGERLAVAVGRPFHPGRLVVLGQGAVLAEHPLPEAATAVVFTGADAVAVAHGRGAVDVLDLASGEVRAMAGGPDDLIARLVAVEGRVLAVTYDGRIALGELADGTFAGVARTPLLVEAVAVSPEGRRLGLALADGGVRVVDLGAE